MSSASDRLATFPERNPNPVLEVDPGGTILYLNPAAREAFPGVQSDPDHPVRRGVSAVYRRLARTDPFREKRMVRVRDRIYDHYLTLSEDEESLYVYLFEREVDPAEDSDQPSMQAFYARVLRDLPTQVAVFDPEGRYLYLNPAAVGDSELREWLIGRTTLDYARYRGLDPETFRERHEWVLRIAEEKEAGRKLETLETRDGEERHILRIVHPILDEDGEVRRLLGYGMDLTDRMRFEHQLRDAKEEAERASRLKTAMLANMSPSTCTPTFGRRWRSFAPRPGTGGSRSGCSRRTTPYGFRETGMRWGGSRRIS